MLSAHCFEQDRCSTPSGLKLERNSILPRVRTLGSPVRPLQGRRRRPRFVYPHGRCQTAVGAWSLPNCRGIDRETTLEGWNRRARGENPGIERQAEASTLKGLNRSSGCQYLNQRGSAVHLEPSGSGSPAAAAVYPHGHCQTAVGLIGKPPRRGGTEEPGVKTPG